jgi:cytochrome b subunit of formate dehydrogenase
VILIRKHAILGEITMDLAVTERSLSLTRPGWLLALSPLPAVAWVAAVIATMSGSGVDLAADLTAAQMDAIRVGWILQWVLYGFATVFTAVALGVLLKALPAGRANAVAVVLVVVSAVVGVAVVVLRVVATGFDEARLGDNGAYNASLVCSYLSAWAFMAAVIVTGLLLRSGGLLRRTGLVVAIVAGLFLALDVLSRAVPPWIVAFYLLAFGVGLLRRRVPSAA